MKDAPRAAILWTLAVFLGLAALIYVGACAGVQKTASVDERSYCYAAVLDEVETIGCAETAPACEAIRKALWEKAAATDSVSEHCMPIRLRLDRE